CFFFFFILFWSCSLSSAPFFPYTTLFRSRYHVGAGHRHFRSGLREDAGNLFAHQFGPDPYGDNLPPGSGTDGAELSAFPLCRGRSEEHTSELQSRFDLVCRLLLEIKIIYL